MKTFRNVTLLSLALAVTLAIAPAAKADYINGSINISAGNDNWTPTQLNFSLTAHEQVLDGTGTLSADFPFGTSASVSGTPLIFGAPTITPLVFSFTSGGNSGTFTFEDLYVITDTSSILSLSGYGWLTETGYDRTFSTFIASGSGTNYGNTASSGINFNILATPAPEPGTLSLFGTGLLGLAGMLRYKFQKN